MWDYELCIKGPFFGVFSGPPSLERKASTSLWSCLDSKKTGMLRNKNSINPFLMQNVYYLSYLMKFCKKNKMHLLRWSLRCLKAKVSTKSRNSSGSALLVPSTRKPLKRAKDKTARGVMNLSCPNKRDPLGWRPPPFSVGKNVEKMDWNSVCYVFIIKLFNSSTCFIAGVLTN